VIRTSAKVSLRALLPMALLVAVAAAFPVAAADAAAAPAWRVLGVAAPTNLPPQEGSQPGKGEIVVYATDVGGIATFGSPTALSIGPLPPGISFDGSATGGEWSCGPVAGKMECARAAAVPAGATAPTIEMPLRIGSSAQEHSTIPLTIEGGRAAEAAEYPVKVTVSSEPAPPGVQAFWIGAFDADGRPSTQAGGHPNLAAGGFLLNTVETPSGNIVPAGDVKDVNVELPPGFIGNPAVTPRCPQYQLVQTGEGSQACPASAAVGFSQVSIKSVDGGSDFRSQGSGSSIYNDEPALGYAAEFAFPYVTAQAVLVGSLRGSDYGMTITAPNIPLFNWTYGAFMTLEGSPAGAAGKAFLTNPTDCKLEAGKAPAAAIVADTWQQPSAFDRQSVALPALSGCEALTEAWRGEGPHPDKPEFSLQPSTTEAASVTAATAHLHVDQAGLTDPGGLASSHLKRSVVRLPAGLVLNPAAADGLASCSEAQIGLITTTGAPPNRIRFNEDAPSCPDASKLGTFAVKMPLLEEELDGIVYLAAQEDNPFHSLIALYLVIDDPKTGVVIKLPGEVRPDPDTGQLTAIFDDGPQLPFEDLTLRLRGGGSRSALATPEVCGDYRTTGTLTPWSAASDAVSEAAAIEAGGFRIATGPGGGACADSEAARPFAPGFAAGTTSATAGGHSPLAIGLTRRDGEQEPTSLDLALPEGLTGKLAGVPYCPQAGIDRARARERSGAGRLERESLSCPAASRIGSLGIAAGFGPEPIHVSGDVYLAGPYEGAPLSSVAIVPVVAGPLDLGDAVIHSPLYVDPETVQLSVKSDPIPTVLGGIPLKLRAVSIEVDRPGFTVNPTSCEPKSVSAVVAGSSGAVTAPASRFQVGGCGRLKFKPKLALGFSGATGRNGHPALTATLTQARGQANIAAVSVALPRSEFLDQAHIRTVCTREQFRADRCPRRAIYGRAEAITPLLDHPLQGPVYLRSSSHRLPDLVVALRGPDSQPIEVDLQGRIDSFRGGLRSRFELVPDAPLSKFVLRMQGGRKGLLVNSRNLCAKPTRATVRLVGQNGKRADRFPAVRSDCGRQTKGSLRRPAFTRRASVAARSRRLRVFDLEELATLFAAKRSSGG
jgi:hypothetical protein